MSQMWNRTLVYLGLREEPEEMYDELPARFVPEHDPYAEHAPRRPNVHAEAAANDRQATREMVGASAGSGAPRGERGGGERVAAQRLESSRRDREPVLRLDDERDDDPRLVADTRGGGGPPLGGLRDQGRDQDRDTSSDEDVRSSNVRPLRVGENLRLTERTPRVAVVEVERFEDVEALGARYRTGQPVLFDVVGDAAVARRVVDFVAGLIYASHGAMTKVGSRAFLLVPDRVEVDDQEQRRLRELGYRVG